MAVQGSSESEVLNFAVALIQNGVGSADNEKERYEYITTRLQEAPFFTLERCKTDIREWVQQKVTVEDALKKFLPAKAYAKLREEAGLEDVQNIMDLHTFKDFFSNVWSREISESKDLTDLIHISEPDPVTCKLSVYYVRLVAEYKGTRTGLSTRETRNLTAEYRHMEFTALTSILRKIKEEKETDVVKDALAFMERLSIKQ